MQVQKSAKHYTEAAEDEIKLLTVCVCVPLFRGSVSTTTLQSYTFVRSFYRLRYVWTKDSTSSMFYVVHRYCKKTETNIQ